MKALVISDRQEIIDYVTPLLKEKGFDLIHYRWIIKALDNIEEIQPDVIVLSAMEYPRHWKTLAGFVQSGIGGNSVKMYLYDTEKLSQNDESKAEGLGIINFSKDFHENKFINVEVAYNESNGLIHFSTGKFDKDNNILEVESILTNGCYLKYVSICDSKSIYSYSAQVENVSEDFSRLKVKEL